MKTWVKCPISSGSVQLTKSEKEIKYYLEIITCDPQWWPLNIYNRLCQVYCKKNKTTTTTEVYKTLYWWISECLLGCWFQPHLRHCVVSFVCLFVCLFVWFFTSHQQSFSYIETGLPGLNQYYARINVSCSRTTTQWGSNPRPFGLESSTLLLSHYAPCVVSLSKALILCIVLVQPRKGIFCWSDPYF